MQTFLQSQSRRTESAGNGGRVRLGQDSDEYDLTDRERLGTVGLSLTSTTSRMNDTKDSHFVDGLGSSRGLSDVGAEDREGSMEKTLDALRGLRLGGGRSRMARRRAGAVREGKGSVGGGTGEGGEPPSGRNLRGRGEEGRGAEIAGNQSQQSKLARIEGSTSWSSRSVSEAGPFDSENDDEEDESTPQLSSQVRLSKHTTHARMHIPCTRTHVDLSLIVSRPRPPPPLCVRVCSPPTHTNPPRGPGQTDGLAAQ